MDIRCKGWSRRAALAACVALPLAVAAQEAFPNKPIQLVIPFAPGDTDQMLRPIADKMGQYLGQPVVMAYKPGAGGGVGAQSVAQARADGYTIVGSSPGSLVVVPLANKEMKYSTESFAPIAAFAEGGLMLIVPKNSKYQTLKDVVADANARPDAIT